MSRQVVVTGVPPFGAFPSLPRALAAYLDERASALDAVSEEVCTAHDRAVWLPSRGLVDDVGGFFAADGFHPSEDGYRRWAEALAPAIRLGAARG